RLWDAATGKEHLRVRITNGNESAANRALGFSADGKQFFFVDAEALWAYEVSNAKPLFRHPVATPDSPGEPAATAISPDGTIFVQFRSKGQVEIRSVATGNVVQKVEVAPLNWSGIPIEFSADSRYFVHGIGGKAIALPIIETSTGRVISRIQPKDFF